MQATELLAGSGSAGRGAARALRNAKVAGSGRLGHFVDDQFESRAAPAGVEENGLVDRAVLLLEGLVIGQDVDGELIPLLVSALQLDLHGADLLCTGLARDGEFVIVARAHAAELV